jgi:organic hydroperoxide reductase OsmC/OhrA
MLDVRCSSALKAMLLLGHAAEEDSPVLSSTQLARSLNTNPSAKQARGSQGVHMVVEASAPDVTPDQFLLFADRARQTCAISKALSVEITMDATLVP